MSNDSGKLWFYVAVAVGVLRGLRDLYKRYRE